MKSAINSLTSPQIKKAQLRCFLLSKLRLHFFCAQIRVKNRKTSLQDLISLNILGIPNKRKVHCQVFLELWVEIDDGWRQAG
jgi:hypothetical protein